MISSLNNMRTKVLANRKPFENIEVYFRLYKGQRGDLFIGKFSISQVVAPTRKTLFPVVGSFSGRFTLFEHKMGNRRYDFIRKVRLENEQDLFILLVNNFDIIDVYNISGPGTCCSKSSNNGVISESSLNDSDTRPPISSK